MTDKKTNSTLVDSMFGAGAHFAYSRSRRHPSVSPFIFGTKNKVEIFDLEKTSELLDKSINFIKELAKENKNILFVGGKSEARKAIQKIGLALAMPYVDGRWIGGTLTNFKEIRKRIEKYERLIGERERGELSKYTKKERLLIDREIDTLESMFLGIVPMKDLPKAMFVVDAKREKIAVKEAHDMGIPVISLVGSDCNILDIEYPIVGNDSSKTSIEFFVSTIQKAYEEGKKLAK